MKFAIEGICVSPCTEFIYNCAIVHNTFIWIWINFFVFISDLSAYAELYIHYNVILQADIESRQSNNK